MRDAVFKNHSWFYNNNIIFTTKTPIESLYKTVRNDIFVNKKKIIFFYLSILLHGEYIGIWHTIIYRRIYIIRESWRS